MSILIVYGTVLKTFEHMRLLMPDIPDYNQNPELFEEYLGTNQVISVTQQGLDFQLVRLLPRKVGSVCPIIIGFGLGNIICSDCSNVKSLPLEEVLNIDSQYMQTITEIQNLEVQNLLKKPELYFIPYSYQ